MAIISIPTSIGGINIPGGIFDGPLSDLDKKDGTFFYKYPRDLESATRAHSVDFTFQEIKEVKLQTIVNVFQEQIDNLTSGASGDAALALGADTLDSITGAYTTVVDEAKKGSGVIDIIGNAAKAAFGMAPSVLKTGSSLIEKGSQFLREPETTNIGHISLYMPEAFNLATSIQYDSTTSIATSMGAIPLLGRLVKGVTNVAEGAGNEAFKVALNRAGFVFNPQRQVLFQGIEFRQFNMSFTFTPYSQDEAEQVKQIIQKFRMYASPKRNPELIGNMFWVPPAIFDIDFRMNGAHNKHLPKLQKCIINNIDVNYAPNGWTTHTDGAPIQTIMTLDLQEIYLVGRDQISDGY